MSVFRTTKAAVIDGDPAMSRRHALTGRAQRRRTAEEDEIEQFDEFMTTMRGGALRRAATSDSAAPGTATPAAE